MDFRELIFTAIEAIKINKLRSILTALGVIIGVAAIILLISIGAGLQAYVSSQFESLGANSIFILPGNVDFSTGGGGQATVNKLTFDIMEKLDRNKGPFITEVSPFIEISITSSYRNRTKITRLVATKSTYFDISHLKAEKGRLFTSQDDKRTRRVAVIGKTVAKDLYKHENPVGKMISLSKKSYKVIGVMESQGSVAGVDIDNQVVIPLATGKILTGSDQVNQVLVKTTSTEVLPQAKQHIERVLLRYLGEDDFSVMTQEQLLSSILQILSVMTIALGGIAAISLLVGGIGISNIMLVSVTERTREIGLRKALGARPRDILSQFLIEAVILSLVGGTIGVAIGYLGSLALSQFLQTAVPLWAVLLGLGFSTGVGIIFGVLPAIRASRLQPIEALRHE